MESVDVSVLRELTAWRAAGHKAILATVVRTWGSSPRPPGSMLALRDDGRVVGSVSGGCIEDDLIDRYTSANGGSGIPAGSPEHLCYGITASEAHRFGLPCGGTLELLLEFNPDADALAFTMNMLDRKQLVLRTVDKESGAVTLSAASEPAELSYDGKYLVTTLGPGYRMLLIGAGQLAEYLSTMALFNGFEVTVCDPRPEYRQNWKVAGVKLVTEMPDDTVVDFAPDKRSCVVALTHDPKLDDLALMEALHSEAFYVGAIGSRRNSANRRARLIEYFGETEESLRRLHGPIGVYIGSKTPPEIAVSIMAEVLATKNAVGVPPQQRVAMAKDASQLIHA